jgi:hypothetical protein
MGGIIMITREFKLYLNAGIGVAPIINANQFDQDEEWIFTLLQEDGTVYIPSTGAIIGLKTDGTTILNAGTVNSAGKVVITETEQMTAVPGSNVFELLIDGNTHGTANFVVFVERRPGDIDNPSESDISLFQEAISAAGNVTQFEADIERLQTEIDQIIAPSGEAPSAAEVQNARIGADGKVYDTLGTAIRTQISDLGDAVNNIEHSIYVEKTESGNVFTIDTNASAAKITSEQSVSVNHYGVNILEYPYFDTSKTSYGVTYTVNSDGSIHVYGTSTGNSNFELVTEITAGRKTLKAGTYTLSGCPEGGSVSLWISGLGQGILNDVGEGVTFTITEDKRYFLKISVKSGQTVDAVFYPQLQVGDIKTEWKPYTHEVIQASPVVKTFRPYSGINTFVADSSCTVTYLSEQMATDGEILDLSDFGAVGDGVADDSVAIQNAINAAEGKILFIPEGTYLFSRTLSVKSGTHIIGCGSKSVFKLADTYSLTPYSWRPDKYDRYFYRYPLMMTERTSSGCIFENFKIEGSTAQFVDQNTDGLSVQGSNHIVRNVIVNDINYFPNDFPSRESSGPGRAINVIFADTVTVENCTTARSGYEGIGVEESANVIVNGNTIGDTCQTGIQVHRYAKHVRITGNSVIYSQGRVNGSMTMDADPGEDMDDIHIQNNYFCTSVIFVAGGEGNIHILDNLINGTISCNNSVYRNKWFIRGNNMNGGIIARCDYIIVTDNMLNVNTGYQMIIIRGNHAIAQNNLATGSVDGVYIESHE